MVSKIKVHLPTLNKLVKRFKTGDRQLKKAMEGYAEDHRRFWFFRFKRNSGGGGDWAPILAKTSAIKLARLSSTRRKNAKKRRGTAGMRGKKSNVYKAVRETDTLLNAVHPKFSRRRGQLQILTNNNRRITYGYGPEGAEHPGRHGPAIAIAKLVRYQQGLGRQIIVDLPGIPRVRALAKLKRGILKT